MKERTTVHIYTISIVSLACLGLVIESIMEGWEFWVPPLMIVGIVIVWFFHITQYRNEAFREMAFLVFCMAGVFFHGVHETSFFDVAVIVMLSLVTFSILNRIAFLNALLIEYIIILLLQIFMAVRGKSVVFDSFNISRVFLHAVSVLCVYFISRQIAGSGNKIAEMFEKGRVEQEAASNDMEDFLVNISHELRTPVNVVNGMSNLLLKKGESEEVNAISEAGLRLSRQIEDIQDFTELKRGDALLEQDKYMITSLINDVVSSFRLQENKELDFVIDLDPKVPTLMKGDIKKLHKILRHLLDNSLKFTRTGGIYIKITAIKREYGVNLNISLTDTGIGMRRKEISQASKGFFQANKKRNRSTGGIGLGLNIVFGFVHAMDGFVQIESEKGKGTTVKMSIPQEVLDETPCLAVEEGCVKNIAFHVSTEKFSVPQVREFYRQMAINLAKGLKVNLYGSSSFNDLKNLMDKMEISHIFMGKEEYLENSSYFDELSKSKDITIAVCAPAGFEINKDSRVIFMPKPLYGFPVVRILNGEQGADYGDETGNKLRLDGIRALIVDDEPMNLVVASGLFRDYGMITDNANSGKEALNKFENEEYDVVFMDHMMPEMDGVEAMKRIRMIEKQNGKDVVIVALTANAVSGAREMFLSEGFDGFISKPIDIGEFERVMKRVLSPAALRIAEGRQA